MEHQLSYAFNSLAQLANCLDSGALIYGVIYFYKEDYEEYLNYFKKRKGQKYKTSLWEKSKYWLTAVIVFIFPINLVVTMAPPIILTIFKMDTAPYNVNENNLGLYGVIIEWISHTSILLIRLPMILATLYIRAIWLVAIDEMATLTSHSGTTCRSCGTQLGPGITSIQTDTQPLRNHFNKLFDHYNGSGTQVASIQGIFKGWFVAKWIIFFLEISAFAATALKPLSDGSHTGNGHEIWYSFTHFLYDIIAFMVIYMCGNLMNHYHTKFYESLEANLQKNVHKDTHHWLMQDTTLIRKKTKYQFIPSLFGVDIPMDSPGYAITILLSVFAVVTQFF